MIDSIVCVGGVFFYMRLEIHVCNGMSIDLLFALVVVSLDHFITSTHSSDKCCYLWTESGSCRTSFAGDSSPIPGDIVNFVMQPESKCSRTSLGGCFCPIPDDMRVCFHCLSESDGIRTSLAGGFFSLLEDTTVCLYSKSVSEGSRNSF